ncbi:related to HHE domain protein [Armillaria ostoyae]|uniref:Related to HHE domain protein n=1 Tax=Armillaria ostoyae TaxID=47428 RepID=A0A284RFQ8_ARMOS|nr:related to HHE domain protein [Armillaria ostoyae]
MATGQAQKTLTAAIKEDHEEMYEYYDHYVKASGNTDAQARWSRQLTWEIARHAVGEEIVVYPLMEKLLGEKGLKLADEDRDDHQRVKEMLSDLEYMEPGSQDHQTHLKQIMDHLHEHNDNEETKDLPLLEPVLGVENSKKTASTFRTTKKFVPTRAHPSAPNKPPYETFLGFLAMPIDKLKDMFSAFPTEEMKEKEQE